MIYSKMISTESAKRLHETKQEAVATSNPSPHARPLPLPYQPADYTKCSRLLLADYTLCSRHAISTLSTLSKDANRDTL